MEFKGTPAPWVAAGFLDGFNIKDEKYGRHIAFAPKQNNAHLIAAAPELLEALIKLTNYVSDDSPLRNTDEFDLAKAAITKALGQQ